MNRLLVLLCLGLLAEISVLAQNSLPPTNFLALDHEHTDGLCLLYNATGSNLLSLIAWQRDLGLDLPTNQVIFVAKPEAKLTLPAGTPFGEAGQPFWILPQSQNPNLLYLGANAERIPVGVFSGSLTIQLKRLEGPGYFMVWQAVGPGQYNIRINTRDGIDASDAFMPITGSHEHFNWGFSSTGVYCATFQAFGQRIGEATNIVSPESTYVFHVLPLPPATNFQMWQKSYWPTGFNPPTTLSSGNPDADAFTNLLEYAFGLSPTNFNSLSNAPLLSFVTADDQSYGALTFIRFKPAHDLDFTVEATSTLPGPWTPLTNLFSVIADTNTVTERVTIRDNNPTPLEAQRFYRLRVSPVH
jgi:surface-anchored protein